MKVICINEEWSSDGVKEDFPVPVFGGEYDVIDCRYFKEDRHFSNEKNAIIRCEEGIYYTLLGYDHMYHSMNFSTLKVDETELVNHREELQTV